MISPKMWKKHFGQCKPGERVSISVAKERGDTVTFSGVVKAPEKDGSYHIPMSMEHDEDGEVPIKKGKISAAMEKPKKKAMSKGAMAAMGY